jgi:tetratricopeptide (TPR) repeat protein
MRCLTLFFIIGGVSLASGCGVNGSMVRADLLEKSGGEAFELTDTAFYPQTTDQCGPAALATVLGTTGVHVLPADLAPSLYIPGRNGSLQIELMAAARSYGRMPYRLDPDIVSLLGELQSGRPVLVLQNLGNRFVPVWHYAVVIGYVPDENKFVLRSGDVRRQLVTASKFLRSWRRADSWGVLILTPGELPANYQMEPFVLAVADLEAVGQFEAATAGYQAAVEHWPENTIAWLGLGNAHYELGQLEMAQTAYSELLKLEPGNVVALNNLAFVLADRGQVEDAIQTVDAALSLTKPADALYEVITQTRAEILDDHSHRRKASPD